MTFYHAIANPLSKYHNFNLIKSTLFSLHYKLLFYYDFIFKILVHAMYRLQSNWTTALYSPKEKAHKSKKNLKKYAQN